jgi:hypothetical protein
LKLQAVPKSLLFPDRRSGGTILTVKYLKYLLREAAITPSTLNLTGREESIQDQMVMEEALIINKGLIISKAGGNTAL